MKLRSLPSEMQHMILNKLDAKSLLAAGSTCKSWRHMMLENKKLVKKFQLKVFHYPTQVRFRSKIWNKDLVHLKLLIQSQMLGSLWLALRDTFKVVCIKPVYKIWKSKMFSIFPISENIPKKIRRIVSKCLDWHFRKRKDGLHTQAFRWYPQKR